MCVNEARESEAEGSMAEPTKWSSEKWWIAVVLNIFFLLAGQTVGTLLGKLYFVGGGNSKWMSTLVYSAGFPVLLVPVLFFPSLHGPLTSQISNSSKAKITAIYVGLGVLIAGDSLMYSYGTLYLPVSTYSLVCASQLAFNAVFAYFLNAQKFTPPIYNSVVLVTFSAVLLGVHPDSEDTSDIPKGKYALGMILTVGASATYSLVLSLTQLTFQKVLRRETFAVVVEMQIATSAVASVVSILGLFASGEWRTLRGEMKGFEKGEVSYVMVLVWIAIAWQVASVGVVGLVFVVSSLFSNVISTLGTPLVPIFSVIFMHDKMDGVKIIAMLIAIWGFISYLYQNYLDDKKSKRVLESKEKDVDDESHVT